MITVDLFTDAIERIKAKSRAAVQKAAPKPVAPPPPPRRSDFENLAGPLNPTTAAAIQTGEVARRVRRPYDAAVRVTDAARAGRVRDRGDTGPQDFRTLSQLPPYGAEVEGLPSAGTVPLRRRGLFEALAASGGEGARAAGRGAAAGGRAVADLPLTPYQPVPGKGTPKTRTLSDVKETQSTQIQPLRRVEDAVSGALREAGEFSRIPGAGAVGEAVGEFIVPTAVWEAELMLVPGFSTVDDARDAIRLLKAGGDGAARVVMRLSESPQGRKIIGRLGELVTEESGFARLGDGDDPLDEIVNRGLGSGEGGSLDTPMGDQDARLLSLRDDPAPTAPSPPPAEAVEPPRQGPPEPPSGVADEPQGRPPTIREIEARSKPLTPEQRARIPRETESAFYRPREFKESTDLDVADVDGMVGSSLQRVQDAVASVPVLKSIAQIAEPMAGARASRKAGNVIPEAIVRRDLFVDTEKALARANMYAWLEEARKPLGLNGKGIARNVGVKPDVEIPAGVRGRLDDIIEHPEDYVLTPEQEAILDRARQTFNAITRDQLQAGVDVREIEGGYFPRIVVRSPKGEPQARSGVGSLTRKPGHAKPREFTDLREGVAAGYTYASPYEAMLTRLETGIESIGGRRTLEVVKELGQKPSDRVPNELRERYLAAKAQYIGEAGKPANRTPATAKELEEAKRALRVAATKANEPSIGEAKAFGRIFPQAVTDEIAKYTDISDPNLIEEYFRVQRASTTTADASAALLQGHNLFFRNNVAWWKALGHSLVSTVREPMHYVAKNIDDIEEAIAARAAIPPSEFQLAKGGRLSQLGSKVPVVKQAQRAFEWMIFVAQVEWWRAARRVGMSPREAQELGAVIRKGTGSMLRPGLTTKQRALEPWTMFAARFAAAVNTMPLDAARGGIRGSEARRTLGSMIGGATALTIAAQMATDGTMPNLTDPRNRHKPWMSVKRPGGTINFFGPLYPYIKAYASISMDLAEGKPASAADEAMFLGRSRLSLPLSSLIDLIYDEDIMGNEVRGPGDFLKSQAKRFLPISARSIAESGVEGLQEFPEGNFQLLGGRANRASDYRQSVNAAEGYLKDSGGDFRTAYDAALDAGDIEATDGLKGLWRDELEPKVEAIGFKVIDGAFDAETGLSRGPRLSFEKMEQKMLADPHWQQKLNDAFKIDVSDAANIGEARKKYITDRAPEYAARENITIDEARDALGSYWDNHEAIEGTILETNRDGSVRKRAKDGFQDWLDEARIIQWQAHPQEFWDAVAVGWEDDSEDERKAIPRPEPVAR